MKNLFGAILLATVAFCTPTIAQEQCTTPDQLVQLAAEHDWTLGFTYYNVDEDGMQYKLVQTYTSGDPRYEGDTLVVWFVGDDTVTCVEDNTVWDSEAFAAYKDKYLK